MGTVKNYAARFLTFGHFVNTRRFEVKTVQVLGKYFFQYLPGKHYGKDNHYKLQLSEFK